MQEIKLKNNEFKFNVDANGHTIHPRKVSESWIHAYNEKYSNSEDENGLRDPQYGALNAIRAHWTVSNDPANIVMPTGTGKTETMYATILSERINTTLIVVPSDQLRKQTYESVQYFGILPDINMLDRSSALMPNTTILRSIPSTLKELQELIQNSNVIVSTISLLSKYNHEYKNLLASVCDALIIDEAHHIGAKTWSDFKGYFREKKILQFTATPYRNDHKKITGKYIYNYPLALAQKKGYFKKIEYYPIREYDDMKGDLAIAEKAVEILKKDIDKGFNHIILARAKTRKRAEELYNTIYNKYYSDLNPVLIISGQGKRKNDAYMEKLKEYKSKIVVCVDMFGEGIDISELKIAAIHDKYKSLPITVQFIGRFARQSKRLGNASLITNIANDDLKDQVDELYQQDSDWNELLNVISTEKVDEQIDLQDLLDAFDSIDVSTINIEQLQMKISTRMFNYKGIEWIEEGWKSVLDSDNTMYHYSNTEKLMILVEKFESSVHWSSQKDIAELGWNLFVIFWDENNHIIHINETDQQKGNKLIKAMFPESTRLEGDVMFRTLNGVNRLMIGTLGLKNELPGKLSYRMFAGTDVAEGVSNAVRGISTKSNIFANGFSGNGKVSIGCSYRGKVWSRWVESIKYWKDWCGDISAKVKDDSIETEDILKGSLKGKSVSKFPEGVIYRAELSHDAESENSDRKGFTKGKIKELVPLYNCELKVEHEKKDNQTIILILEINQERIKFEYIITNEYFEINQIEGPQIYYVSGKKIIPVEEYFYNEPPTVWIIGKGNIYSLQTNIQVELNGPSNGKLSEEHFILQDWKKNNVDLKKESQGKDKKSNTIQYSVINHILKKDKDYLIIFDDDGTGEIADVVAIKDNDKEIIFEFYHCKYSSSDKPGSRVADLYEVCGQTEKSLRWASDYIAIMNRLIKREVERNREYGTRIERGSLNDLNTIKNKLKAGMNAKINMNIVQPGINSKKISDEMHIILLACESYLKETYGSSLKVYCS
ncbi:DEAD/DEAH box helicase [Oceanobacillus jeddahense]|uniref:DEAD/DEAH box helicase family protein n=1 Tax=Oceanobacillus jeddahense TaxID=1462527 RepID=A0ABY5JTX0_9BACI|nr:DEAD/DEAH box helicase family protein [Oceanobacillus jeddahense]UUI02531.1 DEAD/DEAH box helicase family protein [Oceanobacillus jeddahense]